MRKLLFLLALVTVLVACDDGSVRPPITNSNPAQRVLPPEPPLDEDVEIPAALDADASSMFEREFDGRLSTPRPLFDESEETEAPVVPTLVPDNVIAEPTATTSLFGTPFPTRGGFPTSTPYQ